MIFALPSCSSDNEDKKNTSYKNELNFSNNFNFNQLVNGLFSYTVMNAICDKRKQANPSNLSVYKKMNIRLIEALEFGDQKDLFTDEGKYIYVNLHTFLNDAEAIASQTSYVTCGEVKQISEELIKIVSEPNYYKNFFTY
jgi:hypothetical protein|tara:strand:- start:184 stop:603 length:420 start_codon:yes stop_codon:yes gene_type:complete